MRIEVYNHYFKVYSILSIREILHKRYIFLDYSECFQRGKFDNTKIKEVSQTVWREDFLQFPIGFLSEVRDYLKCISITDCRSRLEQKEVDIRDNLEGITLYDYQVEAVRVCLEKKNGIIKIPTSGGKTNIFLSIANILHRSRVLILFFQVNVAKQTYDSAVGLGLDPGLVQGNNCIEDKRIVIASIQSAHKLKDKYDVVIADECHHAGARTYYRILRSSEFSYRLGFSATPFLKDKYKTSQVKKWLGCIEYELSAKTLMDLGKIARPEINIIEIRSPQSIQDLRWPKCEKLGVIDNPVRNTEISLLATTNPHVLILVRLIRHGKALEQLIDNSIFLHGGIGAEEREKEVKRFESDNSRVIIASTIFDEGISIDCIKTIITAGGGKSQIKTIQRIGRGFRIDWNKDTVKIFDFWDNTNYILLRHSRARIADYKKEGYEIKK